MVETSVGDLELAHTTEVARMYEEVVSHPDGDYHFYMGRHAAERYGYRSDDLDVILEGAVRAFAGVVRSVVEDHITPQGRRQQFLYGWWRHGAEEAAS